MSNDTNNNINNNTSQHPDNINTITISEINSKTQIFNIQSNGSKTYDTNNMVKQPKNK